MTVPDRFETDRLLLRKPVEEDAAIIYRAWATDSEVTRYMSWHTHKDLGVTEAIVGSFLDQWESGKGEQVLAICSKVVPTEPIGTIGVRIEGHQAIFGYVLARQHWRMGYMTEALETLVAWALSQPSVWRASAFCDAENRASARVMEKAGMQFEGRLRRFLVSPNVSSEPRDALLYARVRDDRG